jgi:hypothetical protein
MCLLYDAVSKCFVNTWAEIVEDAARIINNLFFLVALVKVKIVLSYYISYCSVFL